MSGYTKLAAFMAEKHHPILKKYQQLAARDLLYLQAELCDLQFRYDEIAKKDTMAKDCERECYGRDWLNMATSYQRRCGGEQWTIALAVRNKLQEYCAFTTFQVVHLVMIEINASPDSAISQYSQIASLPEPKPSERAILHDWIKSSSMGGNCRFLGRDLSDLEQPSVYAAVNQDDLAILSDSHGEDDLFTKFITGPVLTLYHWFRGRSRPPLPIDPTLPPVGENRSSLQHYSDRQVAAVTNFLGTIFSSIAPLVSVVVLSFINNPRARLGLVCAFTILFTICLAIATKARRVEIFAATAAFASVQVVFIGTSNSNL
ncbi:hypothetical protein EG329_001769 [Mollisiaceae sp. DMI_Dod_QoI]|nr:hypothetical protein EG329_001769 [Helotiales sp. DMI_Dod_QoI]